MQQWTLGSSSWQLSSSLKRSIQVSFDLLRVEQAFSTLVLIVSHKSTTATSNTPWTEILGIFCLWQVLQRLLHGAFGMERVHVKFWEGEFEADKVLKNEKVMLSLYSVHFCVEIYSAHVLSGKKVRTWEITSMWYWRLWVWRTQIYLHRVYLSGRRWLFFGIRMVNLFWEMKVMVLQGGLLHQW